MEVQGYKSLLYCWILAAVLVIAPTLARGGTCPSVSPEENNTEQISPPVADQGLRAFVDPETGELTSAPPDDQALDGPDSANARKNLSEVKITTRPNGEMVADVGDRFQRELRAEIIDGKLVTCHAPLGNDATANSSHKSNHQ